YTIDGSVVPVGSLDALDLGNQEVGSGDFARDIDLEITNVSRHPITLDGELPSNGPNLFSYRALSSNFFFGFLDPNTQQLTLDTRPPPLPTDQDLGTFFTNFNGGVGFYNTT